MSYSSFYVVFKTIVKPIATYRNSWGTIPALWSLLGKEYLHKNETWWCTNYSEIQKLLDLLNNSKVPIHLRFALFMTLDNCVVDSLDKDRAIEFLEMTHNDIKENTSFACTNWCQIANTLKTIKIPKRALGLGLGCTSVANPWCNWHRKKHKDYYISSTQIK